MALQDVLRDTNSSQFEQAICGEDAVAHEREKLQGKADEELWALHVRYGTLSAKGLAVLALLKERCPDSFRK